MNSIRITRMASRLVAAATALSMAACAVGPGPLEQRAAQAGYACQQGDPYACSDYQALYPAVMGERQQIQAQNAEGAAVAAGLLGLVAIAAVAGGGSHHHHYRHYR